MAWPGAALEQGDDHAAETPRGPPDDAGRCSENPGICPGKIGLLQGKIMEKPWKNHGKPWKNHGKTMENLRESPREHHVSLASSCLLKRLEDWTTIDHYNFATNSNPFTN